MVTSNEDSICPVCGGRLRKKDRANRINKKIGGRTDRLRIERRTCTNESCRKTHRLLPDICIPYKRYTEDRKPSSKKFCKDHRLELYQGDIKYGPVIRDRDGKKIQTYLSSVIDDHSRLIIQSEWYDNQRKEIVEDTVHRAVLTYGVFDRFYVDNGKQYISTQLHKSCARLGIKVQHAPPVSGKSKGKIERFHQTVDRFVAELAVAPVHSIAEMNEKWKYFLEEDYQKKPHEGIAK